MIQHFIFCFWTKNETFNIIIVSDGVNPSCQEKLEHAYKNGYNNPDEYPGMRRICGVNVPEATRNDYQRYFMCTRIESASCIDKGLKFPTTCSVPPCNQCSTGMRVEKSISFIIVKYFICNYHILSLAGRNYII